MIDSVVVEELRLVADISERLMEGDASHCVRADQMKPLIVRLRAVARQLDECRLSSQAKKKISSSANREVNVTHSSQPDQSLDLLHDRSDASCLSSKLHSASCGRPVNEKMQVRPSASRDKRPEPRSADKIAIRANTLTKPSSVPVRAIPRESSPTDAKFITKEVARAISCSLYNLLESVTNLVYASNASVFIRSNDEMISIANVSKRLSFPPHLLRHRCTNFVGAAVLGSGIALNQRVRCGVQSSLLIFPIFPHHCSPQARSKPLAILSVENKMCGKAPFNESDENVVRMAAGMIGEIMSRVPQMQWEESFYDPITQHIVAPFVPSDQIELPTLDNKILSEAKVMEERPLHPQTTRTVGSKRNAPPAAMPTASFDHMSDEQRAAIQQKLAKQINNFSAATLIRREVLPAVSSKSLPYGLAQIPSLREVAVYVENIQSCWKNSVAKGIEVMEDDRNRHLELHHVRRELQKTRQRLTDTIEQLRLHELGTDDYKQEYLNMASEIDEFFRKKQSTQI